MFSAPTIVSLASTPAYAATGTGVNDYITIDDFTLDQDRDTTLASDGSFIFTTRELPYSASTDPNDPTGWATISNETLSFTMVGGGHNFGVRYLGSVSLAGCTEVVLQNYTPFPPDALQLGIESGGALHTLGGSVIGTDLVFVISGVPTAVLANVDLLSMANPVTSFGTIVASGPLIAR